MLKKITSAAMAAIVGAGLAASSIGEAQAHGRGIGLGIAAGIIGLGVGAAIANAHERPYYSAYDDGRCYRGPRECHWTNRRCFENSYGDTVCRGGRYLCDRPLICD